MAIKSAGRSELTELVANHVFRDQYGNELLAVVHAESKAYELR